MFASRELRVRVLEALEREARQFRTREDLYPLRIPRHPLSLDRLIATTLGDRQRLFDPRTLRARSLLALEWEDGSSWELWVAMLPSNLRLFCDSGDEESRVLASGGRNAGDETDRLFLQLLGESRGEHFGIEMAGGAPSRVRSPVARPLLVDMFVDLFEGTPVEEDVKRTVTRGAGEHDFRGDVDRWLARASSAS
jgi:hypothetical protein